MGTVHSLTHNSHPKRRVLVIEDNLDTVHSMAMLIKAMGHEVDFAINGFAAIEAAKRFKPDVILLDIALPDFRGDKIARQFKFEPGFENVRIVAITGLPLSDVERQARESGCERVYAKPIDPRVLEALLAGTDESSDSEASKT